MTEQSKLAIPPRGTRGSWSPPGFLMKVAQPLMNMQISNYRKKAGPTPPLMMGFPTVLLTTIGAKTGQERTHVLGGFSDGDDAWLIIASKGVAIAPRYGKYPKNTDREIPVIRLTPA